jgi:hypothetical protein
MAPPALAERAAGGLEDVASAAGRGFERLDEPGLAPDTPAESIARGIGGTGTEVVLSLAPGAAVTRVPRIASALGRTAPLAAVMTDVATDAAIEAGVPPEQSLAGFLGLERTAESPLGRAAVGAGATGVVASVFEGVRATRAARRARAAERGGVDDKDVQEIVEALEGRPRVVAPEMEVEIPAGITTPEERAQVEVQRRIRAAQQAGRPLSAEDIVREFETLVAGNRGSRAVTPGAPPARSVEPSAARDFSLPPEEAASEGTLSIVGLGGGRRARRLFPGEGGSELGDEVLGGDSLPAVLSDDGVVYTRRVPAEHSDLMNSAGDKFDAAFTNEVEARGWLTPEGQYVSGSDLQTFFAPGESALPPRRAAPTRPSGPTQGEGEVVEFTAEAIKRRRDETLRAADARRGASGPTRLEDLSPEVARESRTRVETVAPDEQAQLAIEAAKAGGRFQPNVTGVDIPEGRTFTTAQMQAGARQASDLAAERGRLIADLEQTAIDSPERAALVQRLDEVTQQYVNEADKVLGSVSEAARTLATHGQMLRRMPQSVYGVSSYVRREIGGSLTDGQLSELRRFLDIAEDGSLESVDNVGLARWIERQKDPLSWGDVEFWTSGIRSGMLSALYSPLRSVVGNTTSLGIKIASAPVRSLFDWAVTGLMRSKAGMEPIQRSARLSATGLKQAVRGVPSDLRASLQVLTKGMTPEDAVKLENRINQRLESGITLPESLPGVGGKDVAQVWTQLWFRAQGMVDTPLRRLIARNSIGSQAAEVVRREGLQGAEAAERLTALIASPTPPMQARAMQDAAFYAFQNETALGSIVEGVRSTARRASPVLGGAVDLTIPFARTPSAIATRSFQATPFGFIHNVNDLARLTFLSRGKSLQELQRIKDQLVRRVGDQSVTLPLAFLVGGSLAREGRIVGGMPENAAEREQFLSEGKVPYGIRIGNRWWSLAQMPPLGHVIALGAMAEEVRRDAEEARALGAEDVPGFPEQAAAVGAGAIDVVAESPLGQGAERIADLLGASGGQGGTALGRRATQALTQTAGSIVPNLAATVARADDPIRLRRRSGVGAALKDVLLERTPGLSRELPPRVSPVLGQVLEREETPRGRALSLIDPFGSSPARTASDPVIRELSESGTALSRPGRLPGEGDVEFNARMTEEAPKVREALVALFSDDPDARRTLARYGVSPALAREYGRLETMGDRPEVRQAKEEIIKEVVTTVRRRLTARRKK